MTRTTDADPAAHSLRVRAITAGTPLESAADGRCLEDAVGFLSRAREGIEAVGYEVQSVRAATQPLVEYATERSRDGTLEEIVALDRVAVKNDLVLSIGPATTDDRHDESFAEWAAELIRRTRNTSFSVSVASAELGAHRRSARTAAEAIAAISRVQPAGEGNFRFAAAARAPAGTPFFPVSWFHDKRTFSLGLESAGLLSQVFSETEGLESNGRRLRERLNRELKPLAELARKIARQTGWRFLGIDASPAPGFYASIGEAIERLTGAPFGDPSTLAGCAAITDVLHGLEVETCGYSGLMLPPLEDLVLARRAAERRYGVSDLLLYSSVCGTGLDTVPLPGDTAPELLTGLIQDTAALAVKYAKPLSVRLLPIPGKAVGDEVSFENPHLTDGVVMDPAS